MSKEIIKTINENHEVIIGALEENTAVLRAIHEAIGKIKEDVDSITRKVSDIEDLLG